MDVLSTTLPQQNRSLTSTHQQAEREVRNDNKSTSLDDSVNKSANKGAKAVQVSVSDVAKSRAQNSVLAAQTKEDARTTAAPRPGGTEESHALASQQSVQSQRHQAAKETQGAIKDSPSKSATLVSSKASREDTSQDATLTTTPEDSSKAKLAEKATAVYRRSS